MSLQCVRLWKDVAMGLSWNVPRKTEKNHRNVRLGNMVVSRGLNRVLPKYKGRVLSATLVCSVFCRPYS
jgi:hypothetical protein